MENDQVSTGRKASVKLLEALPSKEKFIVKWIDTITDAYDIVLHNSFYLTTPVKLPKGYVSKQTGKDEDTPMNILNKLNKFIGNDIVWTVLKEAKKEDHYIDDVEDTTMVPFIGRNI
jgi:hypothetical protein